MRKARALSMGLLCLAAGCALGASVSGCASTAPKEPEKAPIHVEPTGSVALAPPVSSSAPNVPKELTLAILPRDFDFSKNPGVVVRIAESPHHYFRFINPRFTTVVCHRYADWLHADPIVALHGDAHIEQYGVTDLGRGLTDLDDTAKGPRLFDLLRMSTSIVIVVGEKADGDAAFQGRESEMLGALLRGYAEGVRSPDKEPPKSPLDERLEKRFVKDRKPFLAESEKSMLPFASPAEEDEAKKLHAGYEKWMLQANMYGPKNKDFPGGSFVLKKMGPIAGGIGSALDQRFLMRLEGRTSGPDDDLVVELKSERSPEDPTCLAPIRDYRPARFLMGRATAHPFDPTEVPGSAFWAGEWNVNHKIVKVDKTIETPADLESIAFESGFVLGREHLRSRVDGPARPTVLAPSASGDSPMGSRADFEKDAQRLLAVDDATRARILEVSKALASEIVSGWRGFRDAAPSK